MTRALALRWRQATALDAELLAKLNRELIEDEGHHNPMNHAELAERLRGWLATEYHAVLFQLEERLVAYALYREDEWSRVHIRHFFVARGERRRGIGREAMRLLETQVVLPGKSLILEVLTANAVARAFYAACGFEEYALTLLRTPRAPKP